MTLTDDGATIVPGAGCTAVSSHSVRCVTGGFPALSAQLGDGDDRATVSGLLSAVIDGGAGDDTLAGGDARDVLEGGPGADDLSGGAGDDALFGDGPGLVAGGGADRLNGGPGADALDCGAGVDTVVDGEAADVADGCEQAASSTPPATAEATPPRRARPRAADPMDPGVIVPLQQVSAETARSTAIVPVRLTLRGPRRSPARRCGASACAPRWRARCLPR